MPAWLRSSVLLLSTAGLAADSDRLVEEKWSSLVPNARPHRAVDRTVAVARERGSDVPLFGHRWRAPYVITIQPYMTSVKLLINASTPVRNKSYLLRTGSNFTAARERVPALRIRSVGGSLAQESGNGRCHSRQICRRRCAGF